MNQNIKANPKIKVLKKMNFHIHAEHVKRGSQDLESENRTTRMNCLQATRYYYNRHNDPWSNRYYHWYTFTITPKDHKGCIHELKLRVEKFNSYKSYLRCFFIHEVSNRGMHHLHGICQFKDTCKFTKLLKDEKYHYYVDPFLNMDDKWFNYILKTKPTAYRTHERGAKIIYQGFTGDRKGAPFLT